MRRFFSLMVLVGLLCAGTIETFACVSRSTQRAPRELTIIVMDTTQALLPEAEVRVGKLRLTTAFDGRVVLPEAKENSRLTVRCDGYKSQTLRIGSEALQCVYLVPEKVRQEKNSLGGGRHHHMVDGADVYYSMKTAGAPRCAVADELIEVETLSATGEGVEVKVEDASADLNIGAGLLTAGEVNDFAKWSFWPNVLDGSHKQFVQTWHMAARHRYTVQLTNREGYPIAAKAVSLLDANGNTLYQAVTDNTGKAELWFRLIGDQPNQEAGQLFLQIDDQRQEAKEWAEGLNLFVTDEPCESSKAVDVLFVFDATGSMGDELRYLQAEMRDVIARAASATGGLSIRTGAVVYRDHGDEYLTRISRLTDDIATTQTFIDKQAANGGGDYPEAVPEALMAALNSGGWDEQARARILFLVLDAPCHEDSATLVLLHEQVLNAAALGVRIVPVVCSGLGESGELLLREMALATNGTSFFLTDDSGIGGSHLKPTTDSLKVEHLNDMLVRTIVEYSTMLSCASAEEEDVKVEERFVPNPFNVQEIERDSTIAQGPQVLYLMDISGKLLGVYTGDFAAGQLPVTPYRLPMGVYFIKAFYDGEWHTRKFLVSGRS